MRKIKKYSNRRLYDSTSSSYINIEEVIQLIRAGEEVQIIEDSTGKDITNNILLQSILETNATVQLFPSSLLHRLIRVQSKEDLQDSLSTKLASGLQMLDAQLARLENSDWMNMASWKPFSGASKEKSNGEEPSPQEETSSPEAEEKKSEEPVTETDNGTDIHENETASTPEESTSSSSKEKEKRSVAEQQLDTIRAHIASLEARLRKK